MPEPRQQKKPKKISKTYLHNAGLSYLQRFASSTENFRSVMMRKIRRSCAVHETPAPEDAIEMLDALIIRFTELGLLNDREYARMMTASLTRKGLSEKAIYARLKNRGIPKNLVREHLEEEAHSDSQAALRFAQRKRIGPFRKSPLPDDPLSRQKQKNKEFSALARAGFDFETARRVLEQDPSSADMLL